MLNTAGIVKYYIMINSIKGFGVFTTHDIQKDEICTLVGGDLFYDKYSIVSATLVKPNIIQLWNSLFYVKLDMCASRDSFYYVNHSCDTNCEVVVLYSANCSPWREAAQ